MKLINYSLGCLSLVIGLLLANNTLAAGSEIKFSGFLSAISQADADVNEGTVTVTLHGFPVFIDVNLDTEIEADGEEIDLAQLTTDDFVKIEAFISPEGITADSILLLDGEVGQFRARGLITAVSSLADITTITVIGVDINADADTAITRRASGQGNQVPASELAVGDLVNLSGGVKDDALYAQRIHVGNRQEGEIELEGEVLVVNADSIKVLIDDSIETTVLMDENTSVSGELIVGAYVEVEGQLTPELDVLGFEIVVDADGDGDADDDNQRGRRGDHNPDHGNSGGNGQGKGEEASLRLSSPTETITASVKYKYVERGPKVIQKVAVELEDGAPATDYTIHVAFADIEVDFDTLTTDEYGNAEIEFETDDDGDTLTALLPENLDVTDITAIEIRLDGSIVLQGSF